MGRPPLGVKIAGVIGRAKIRRLGFWAFRGSVRFVRHMNIDLRIVGGHRLREPGAMLIAPTHMGHIEPMLLSGEIDRPVYWVARTGLFRLPWGWAMRCAGTIELDQHRVCTEALRQCMRRLAEGRLVGIFPEGKVTRGPTAAAHGAPVYGGTALISLRTGVPILPIVVLGTDEMVTIESWIPGNRTRVAIGVGEPVVPPPLPARRYRRAARRELNVALAEGFQRTYRELVAAISEGSKMQETRDKQIPRCNLQSSNSNPV